MGDATAQPGAGGSLKRMRLALILALHQPQRRLASASWQQDRLEKDMAPHDESHTWHDVELVAFSAPHCRWTLRVCRQWRRGQPPAVSADFAGKAGIARCSQDLEGLNEQQSTANGSHWWRRRKGSGID
jgi:hypothetical protein